jgi:hypothetical protein
MLEFTPYSLIVFVHVVAAVALFGSSFVAPLTLQQIRRARTIVDLRTWVEFERRSTKWNPAAAFVLLGTGIYLGSYGWWTQPWFFVSIASWILSSGLAGGIVGRTTGLLVQRIGTGVEAGVPADVDRLRWSRAWTAANAALVANDLTMLYVMFNKPALAGSLGLLVVANAAAVGLALVRHRTSAEPGLIRGTAPLLRE